MIHLRVMAASGERFARSFDGQSLVIGRSKAADLQLTDGSLSRRHARLFYDQGCLLLEDLGSRNGTFLNGKLITAPVPVQAGDEIRVCESTVSLFDPQAPVAEPPSRSGDTIYRPASDLIREQTESEMQAIGGERALRRYAERLKILNEVHRASAGSLNREELLELILQRVFDHLRPAEAVIFLREPDGEFRLASSRRAPDLEQDYLYSRTLIHEVSDKGLAALVRDIQDDSRFADAESILVAGVRSLIAAPLLIPSGSLGMIALHSSEGGREFSEDDLTLLTSLASVAALRLWTLTLAEEAIERRRLEDELALARHIQVALLPERLPEIPGYQLHASTVPSRMVSGDFYKLVERAEGKEWVLLVADVSGKGVAASLLTATLEALCAPPIAQGQAADQIFDDLSGHLHERTPPEKYATAFLAVLQPHSGRLSYANAGHSPALVVTASGETRRLNRTGVPLGLLPESTYGSAELTLASGDTLVVYTDGIVEATDPEYEEYSLERLTELCSANCQASVAELVAELERDLERFTAGQPYADDRTLIVLRRLTPSGS